MSRDPDNVNKLTESTYKNVMEHFNPGLRNLVILGKNYEKSVTAMTLAGSTYFDAVWKIGENAAASPVSKELGTVLMEISEMHKKVHTELEESFKRFYRDLLAEFDRKNDMDVKYMNATFKRYQSEHKMRQDSLDKTHADLKKLRRKSQAKHSSKYEIKENEYVETISVRQTDMKMFMVDGYREALLEEKRRFCFLVEKHCGFTCQMAEFHDKAKEMLSLKLPSWQNKHSDALQVPDTVITMSERTHNPLSNTLKTSPHLEPFGRNSDPMVPPPAPPMKAHTSPLANMFSPEIPRSTVYPEPYSDQDSLDGSGLSGSTSVSSDKPRVQTIFPHTAGNNESLLSFDDGEIITLLILEERDGWLYGELDKNGQKGWFPSSYCRPYESVITSRMNMADLLKQSEEEEEEEAEEEEQPVFLPPPDYGDSFRKPSTASPQSTVSLSNGTSKPPFLGGGNPFATVRLRPTVTNDRSAPVI